MKTIEERVLRLEDRAAINDLVVAYFLAADGDDADGVGESFACNATFSSSGILNATGRQQIVDFIGIARTSMGLTIHTPHYAHLTFRDVHRASGIVGAHLELVLDRATVYGAVRYVDEYVRGDDRWRIAARDMRTIHMAPWLEAGEALASDNPVRWPGATPSATDFPRL